MKFRSQVFTAVSGSIGGITYSHNRGGMYTRGRATPVNPSTTAQQRIRMYVSTVVGYWTNTLTDAERTSWNDYAANVPLPDQFGEPRNVTGQQMWTRSGVPWLLAGKDLADIATAPVVFDLGDPGVIGGTNAASAGGGTFITSIGGSPAWAADDDAGILLQLSEPHNPTKNYYKAPFRFTDFVPGDSGTPITAAQADGSNADPAITWQEGQKMVMRARVLQSDGRLSQAFLLTAISAA